MTDTAQQPDPNDQMVDPPVTPEDMDAFLKSLEADFEFQPSLSINQLFTREPPATNQDGDEPEEPADGDGETPAPEGEEGDEDDYVTVNGVQVPKADIQRLYEFDQYLRTNQDAAQRVAQALATPTGESTVPPATPPASEEPATFTPPEPPEHLDLDDPQIKTLWDMHVATLQQSWQDREYVKQTTATIAADRQRDASARAAAHMEQALATFRGQFANLNDDDIAVIRREAGPLLPAMMQQLPPVEALRRSMEVAAWANSDVRPKLVDPELKTTTTHQRSQRRKQALGSIAGTPRSAPKTDSRPQYQNDREMVQQVADAIAESTR